MQFIEFLPITADAYVREEFHRRVQPPSFCRNCKTPQPFQALGYYSRSLTIDRHIVTIHIRRFRCSHCGRTASILPSFAQPYRLVQNCAIHDYFETGSAARSCPWATILRNYWNRFLRWLPELWRAFANGPYRAPPFNSGPEAWGALRKAVGNLERITEFLVVEFQITPFGRYRCHGSTS